jgi:hypothetical protein
VTAGVILRRTLALICAAVLCSCEFALFPPPPATPAPFCAQFTGRDLGSLELDYAIAPPATLAVSAADAERAARDAMGLSVAVTTCSVRLARYDNLSKHVAAVWVVHLDGLSWPALGGAIFASPQPSPRILRRAIVVVTTEAPAKLILSIASGP